MTVGDPEYQCRICKKPILSHPDSSFCDDLGCSGRREPICRQGAKTNRSKVKSMSEEMTEGLVGSEEEGEKIEVLARYAAWIMRIASKEINGFIEEHNRKVEPWHYKDAMTSFELDKTAWKIERLLYDLNKEE